MVRASESVRLAFDCRLGVWAFAFSFLREHTSVMMVDDGQSGIVLRLVLVAIKTLILKRKQEENNHGERRK